MNAQIHLKSFRMTAVIVAAFWLAAPAQAATTYYFDVNGATAGSGVTNGGNYSWGDANWSADSAGTLATVPWSSDGGSYTSDSAVFVAGADLNASVAYTVNLDYNLPLNGIVVNSGNVTLNQFRNFIVTPELSPTVTVNQGASLKLAGNLTGSGTLTMAPAPAGIVRLSGDNSGFSGTVQHTGPGAVFLTSESAASANAAWQIDANLFAVPGTFNLGSLSGNGNLSPDEWDVVFSVGALNQSTTFGGTISDFYGDRGSAALTLVGGRLTLTGASTYLGTTTIDGGTLQLGTGNSGEDGSLDSDPDDTTRGITNNGALVFNLHDAQNPAYSITGSGSLTKLGLGALTLNMPNDYLGGTTVQEGTLILATSAAIADGTSLTVGDPVAFSPAPTVPQTASTIANAAITTVPEPGTLALVAAGAMAAGWSVRRRKKTSRTMPRGN